MLSVQDKSHALWSTSNHNQALVHLWHHCLYPVMEQINNGKINNLNLYSIKHYADFEVGGNELCAVVMPALKFWRAKGAREKV